MTDIAVVFYKDMTATLLSYDADKKALILNDGPALERGLSDIDAAREAVRTMYRGWKINWLREWPCISDGK